MLYLQVVYSELQYREMKVIEKDFFFQIELLFGINFS